MQRERLVTLMHTASKALKRLRKKTYPFAIKGVREVWTSVYQTVLVLYKGGRLLTRHGYKHARRVSKHAHHHAAHRPHVYLASKWNWYGKWHQFEHHSRVHATILAAYVLIVGGVLVGSYRQVLAAADLFDNWNFSTISNFTLDPGTEGDGTTVRLKAQNYTNDANTSALYHADENTGTALGDSSSNGNNATATGAPAWVAGSLNYGLSLNGTSQYASAPDTASLSLGSTHSIEAWTKFGTSLAANTTANRRTIADKGAYKLYYDSNTGKVTYELASAGATNWTQAAGNDVNRSWDLNGKLDVRSSISIGSNVYAGLGTANAAGDAEVWKWDGTTWSQIGGDGLNGSWPNFTYENIRSMAANGNTLYIGLGDTAGDAEVWSCDTATNCADWTKIGGDGLNPGGGASWPAATYESVDSLAVLGGNLYAGLGASAQDAEVWRFVPGTSTWTKIGGDGVNPGGGISWAAADNIEDVYSITTDGSANIYVGLGLTTLDAEVWRYNTGTNGWTKIGGDGVNPGGGASWNTNYEYVLSLTYFGGNLYAGLGNGAAGDAEVWRLTVGTNTWSLVGGDGFNPGGGASWADATFEGVYSLANDGTNLYAGLGASTADAEVWRLNGTTWTKMGGDSVNPGGGASWATGSVVYSMATISSTLYVGQTNNTLSNAEMWSLSGTTWSRIGGSYVNKSWGYFGTENVSAMAVYGDKLYAGLGSSTGGDATVWQYDGTTWSIVGGQGIAGSWAHTTIENVLSMVSHGGYLYVGTGVTAGDGDLWRYDGSVWAQVGGDSINLGGGASWAAGFEGVYSLASYNGRLYAGLGASAQDAEVWELNGNAWVKRGGDGVNPGGGASWTAASNMELVNAMTAYNGSLYVGLGNTAGDGDLWRLNGTTWTLVAGDGLNGSWAAATFENVNSLGVYNNKLVVGLGDTAGDADLWQYDGTTWSQIGGDGINNSWGGGSGFDFERIRSLQAYNGNLYAATGSDTGDGAVWQYNGTTWSQVGGGGLNSSWDANTSENVWALTAYKGKLFAAIGDTANVDAAIYSYGNNAVLTSAAVGQDTNWHHIAATYDGATLKLFIDGVLNSSLAASLTVPDNALPLLLGADYGTYTKGTETGLFGGSLDEVRISNIARSSFTTKPYADTPQTVSLANAVRSSGVWHWDDFTSSETTNGGTINYRLSNDNGATWQYWNGSGWVLSASTTQANTVTAVDANIATFPATFSGIKWQAVLAGDGTQRVTLNTVGLASTSDTVAPSANATSVTAQKANGGTSLASNGWTNGGSPYFAWTAGTDADSGVKGYCLYLGTDNSADPATAKGLLGVSPGATGGHCQFMVTGTNLDTAVAGYLASPLTTSSSAYYLTIKTMDNAGNLTLGTTQFQFRFDNTAPNNPGFITAPSGFVNSKDVTLTWPTGGGSAASDANSGLAGLQYRINATTWYGDTHSGTGDNSDLLTNDGSYSTISSPDYANLGEGVNTVYFRTWDQAGNVTTSYVTAAVKINTAGAPSEPQNLQATPATNTANSFAFSWSAPATYVGSVSNLTYCYTINTLPSLATCTFTAGGITSLGAAAYATQPGPNVIYVVAKDESNNISYASYASANFTANTPSPGIPLNADIVDVSIKSTSNWRLALTWDAPGNVGAGIASYKVYRSLNNTSFTFVGSSSSTTYIDAGLAQQRYYYRIRACDSTNNCGADSGTVDDIPTGKFTSAATLVADPSVSDITTRRARVRWSTDRASDSKIAIGTSSGQYGASEVAISAQTSAHVVDLNNLAAGTTYYYVAKWTDEDGNTATSQEFTFRTAPAPVLKEITITKVALSGSTIRFTSRDATRVDVYYGQTEGFGGLKSINTSTAESDYSVELTGLIDGAKYFYKLVAFDNEGNSYDGSVSSFTTPQRPRIADLRFQPVAGEPTSTQLVSWTTNVPATSTITYGKVGAAGTDVQNSELVTLHEIILRDLEDDSEYFLIASGRDVAGNLATSDQQQFRTALDTRPPKISDIVVEASIRGTGAEARGQVVMSWKTDEPATSQVAYAEGSNAAVFNSKTSEDSELGTEHIVIVSDLPTSKVYSLRPLSKDRARNEGVGETQSAIVGRASDSVLTIILNSLQKVFGL